MASPIMKSLDPRETMIRTTNPSPECDMIDMRSLCLETESIRDPRGDSVHLLDNQETLLIKSEKDFLQYLKIDSSHKVKVVAIFGNTGEGKSHTLNHTFFDGEEAFKTSPSQYSCTAGVWAKYNPKLKLLCLDTEGLLGLSNKENRRTRLLLKILAVSDVIIYRTRAERLNKDMYTFLGGASKAYKEHFSSALLTVLQKYGFEKPATSLGPAVIIFHETRYTDTLEASCSVSQSPEDVIREEFARENQSFDGFSSLKYIGIKSNTETFKETNRKTVQNQIEDVFAEEDQSFDRGFSSERVKSSSSENSFKILRIAVETELESTNVRSARDPKYIFYALKVRR